MTRRRGAAEENAEQKSKKEEAQAPRWPKRQCVTNGICYLGESAGQEAHGTKNALQFFELVDPALQCSRKSFDFIGRVSGGAKCVANLSRRELG